MFDFDEARALLARTPDVLSTWLEDLPPAWLDADEGDGTYSPREVLAHLIQGERDDWMVRARIIAEEGEARPFEPFDRFAQRAWFTGRDAASLLAELRELRQRNLEELERLLADDADLDRTGRHPELGAVTLRMLLATWTVHDLAHLGQIARVMAKRYASDVGPWSAYVSILTDRT